jgi:hypothetical protein
MLTFARKEKFEPTHKLSPLIEKCELNTACFLSAKLFTITDKHEPVLAKIRNE